MIMNDSNFDALLTMALREPDAAGWQARTARLVARLTRTEFVRPPEPAAAPSAQPRPISLRTTIAAAACLLTGAGVVAALSWPRGGFALESSHAVANAPSPQDTPKPLPDPAPPTTITDQDVPRRDFKVAGMPADAAALHVAKATGLSVVSAPLRYELEQDLLQSTGYEALTRIAQLSDAHLEQYGRIVVLVPGRRQDMVVLDRPTPRESIDFDRPRRPVREQLAVLTLLANASIAVADELRAEVAVKVADCPWRDLLDLLAKATGAEVIGCGEVIALYPARPAARVKHTLELDASPAAGALAFYQKLTDDQLDRASAMPGDIALRIVDQPATDAWAAIAAATGHAVERGPEHWRWRRADRSLAMHGAGGTVAQPAAGLLTNTAMVAGAARPVGQARSVVVSESTVSTDVWVDTKLVPAEHTLHAIAAAAGGRLIAPDESTWRLVPR
jgi:hypothetical protein